MVAMKSFVLIASVLLGVGCGGGLESDLTSYKDKMCACTDNDCAEKVSADYKTWAKAHRDEAKSMAKDKLEKLDAIDKEFKDCRRKIRDGAKKDGSGSAGSAEAAPAKP